MLLRLTVRRELVPFKHGDAEDVLLEVLYEKLTVGVPLWIQCVLQREREIFI